MRILGLPGRPGGCLLNMGNPLIKRSVLNMGLYVLAQLFSCGVLQIFVQVHHLLQGRKGGADILLFLVLRLNELKNLSYDDIVKMLTQPVVVVLIPFIETYILEKG